MLISYKSFLIENKLKSIGFLNLKRESIHTISVLTDDKRTEVLEKISNSFEEYNTVYDPNKGSSSVGAVIIDEKFIIKAKPVSKQGRKSAGIENEDVFIKNIKFYTRNGPINVKISDGSKTKNYMDVIDIEDVSRNVRNRTKADVNLILQNGEKIPISIKKDNAEMWESADTYFAETAKKIIDKLVESGEVSIEKIGLINILKPNIAITSTEKEKKDVVFGNDILNNGFVAIKSFDSSDFNLNQKNKILEINVSKIIDNLDDVKGKHDVYFLIRHDSTRNVKNLNYRGLRVVAVSPKRLNKNVKIVSR